ncbi:MAG: CDP-alcohol phosphatidyltransferase family protein, partial [Thermoguttaceae bacterium]
IHHSSFIIHHSSFPMSLIHLLILNYNGRQLLEECLPSVVEAAQGTRHECRVAVIDNDSSDDSVAWLENQFPQVEVIRRPNRGLCSFNEVVAGLEGRVAILLNNDIKLERDAIDPWVAPLLEEPESRCFMTAPLCWRFDGGYEGFKTAVCWRWGLVQATALYPGHEPTILQPGRTASAGAALAVNRDRFVELGGFDPRYLPGRLEDLDFALRAYQAGYHARYVPAAVVWHLGMATFGRVFGPSGCDQLALRNTLLFQWKNLRHPAHLARQGFGLPVRLLADIVRAPWTPKDRRWAFSRALVGALRIAWGERRRATGEGRGAKVEGTFRRMSRERAFFEQFHPERLREGSQLEAVGQPAASSESKDRHQAWAYPISRWYIRPLAARVAATLVPTRIRPVHLTICGLLIGLAACGLLVWQPTWTPLAATLVLAAWFCDRTDGQLARKQHTVTAFGAWLDGNVDELLDVAWHVAAAAVLAGQTQATWPWLLVLAFVAGKYLFMQSLATEEHFGPKEPEKVETVSEERSTLARLLRTLWHLPGNADVRIHLLIAALATGFLAPELWLLAVYYNLRWIVRYGLVARRLGGCR